MSRNLNAEDIENIKMLVSEERLRTFRVLTTNDANAIELHQATMSMGAGLMSTIAIVEIALRNSIFVCLEHNPATRQCIFDKSTQFRLHSTERKSIKSAYRNARRLEYSKLPEVQKKVLDKSAFPDGVPPNIAQSDLAESRQSKIEVSDGQVIAQLPFSFWKRLFSERYEETLWKRSLKKVFPNKTLSRTQIVNQIEKLHLARNRLAHHEPVYGVRLTEAVHASDFVMLNLGSRTPNIESPVTKLILPHRERLENQMAIFTSTWSKLTRATVSNGKIMFDPAN